ncbi:MAG: hypothetical protein E6X17_16845 [Sporomusaceae bacterium]|nr:hypothetical protein [Sporomusaceae bacterium]
MKKQLFAVLAILTMLAAATVTGHSAPAAASRDWTIDFMGTLQVPVQLEIVDAKEVILGIEQISRHERAAKGMNTEADALQAQELAAALARNNIGIYQLALKRDNSYHTAIAFAAKLPEEMLPIGLGLFEELQSMDQQQQTEIRQRFLAEIETGLAASPELAELFNVEVLELYPFEQMTSKSAQIVSVGGSLAFRMYKLIQPAAFKVHFIRRNSQMYVFGVMNSGTDRRLWEDMTQAMLASAQWRLLL